MKYCTYCGAGMDDGVSFCPNCGAKASDSTAGTTTAESVDSVFGSDTVYTDTRDYTPSTGVAVLSFLLPLVGGIMYLVWKDTKPGKATSALKGLLAWLSYNVPIVGVILYFVWKDEKKDFAKIAGIWGIVGFVLGIIAAIGSVIFSVVIAMIGMEYEATALIAASMLL